VIFAQPSAQITEQCVNTGHDHFHVRPNSSFTIILQPDELLGNLLSQTDQMTVNSPTFSKNQEFIAGFTKAPAREQVLGSVS
jgi:hypothetical protein